MEERDCNRACQSAVLGEPCPNEISCYTKIAGTLTGEEIRELGLIKSEKNSPKDCFQATTYDLTLGEGHYIYDGNNTSKIEKWKLVFIGSSDERLRELNEQNPESEQYRRLNRDKPQTLSIPPYGSAFVQLNETVDTYTVAREKGLLIVGRFDLKLSNVHQGLISQQATQVEPCYSGKLFCFIHNLSDQQINLKYGQKMATIEFSYVSCFCNKQKRSQIIDELITKNKEKYDKPFCTDQGISEVRYFHADEQLPDNCGLLGLDEKMRNLVKSGDIVDDLVEKVSKKVNGKAVWIPVVTAIIAGIFAILPFVLGTPKKQDIQELQQTISSQNQMIEKLQTDINSLEIEIKNSNTTLD